MPPRPRIMARLREEIAAALAHTGRARLTVVRSGGLGDTLLVMPALQFLLEERPAAEITLIGSAWAERLRPLLACRLALLRFDSPLLTPLFKPSCAEDPTGAFAGADAAVVYTARPHDELVLNVRRLCPGPVVAWPVEPAAGAHAAAHFAGALADSAPKPSELRPPELRVGTGLRQWAGRWLAARLPGAESPVAVHPGSGGADKCWPAERFAALVQRLEAPVVLFRGPADAAACRRLERLLGGRGTIARAEALSVPEAAALLLACNLYIGNDSGLTHLAAAVGAPAVAVFGPTDPEVWAPLGPSVIAVRGAGPADPWPSVDRVSAVCAKLAR